MDLILMHEYAHCLHNQWRPDDKSTLKNWIVSEGMASVFPTLLAEKYSIYDGLWMMSKENIDWCMQHEHQIIDSLYMDLEKDGIDISKKYIAGGKGFATPPKGFPEKTGYYIGYKIIESCLAKGIPLKDLCIMNVQNIISKSDIFKAMH